MLQARERSRALSYLLADKRVEKYMKAEDGRENKGETQEVFLY